MPRNVCSVCDNDSFENISGYYYCTVCNTKAQVKIHFILWFDNIYKAKIGAKSFNSKEKYFFLLFVRKTKLSFNF